MNPLLSYLRPLKGQLANCHSVVLGNQAADLDSMVAAVAYGFLLHSLHPERTVAPLINIPRAEFCLRPEAVLLFDLVGIGAEDLIFNDDSDQDELFEDSVIILVDQNTLPIALKRYSEQVCSILDHHKDEGMYCTAEPRIVQRAGSCCSLVAMAFMRQGQSVTAEVASLLMGTLLLDTVNLDSTVGKTCEVDREALQLLIPLSPQHPDVLFKRLRVARLNVSMFTASDLLRRDYKEYCQDRLCWGIAVIPLDIREFLSRQGQECLAVHSFARERSLEFLLLMFFSNSPDFRRQLMVYWSDGKRQEHLLEFLQNGSLNLRLIQDTEMEGLSCGDSRCYQQGNSGLSRKAIQPLVADFLNLYP